MSLFDANKKPLPDNDNGFLYLQGYTPQEILEIARKQIYNHYQEEQAKEKIEKYLEKCLEDVLGDLLNK